MKTDRFSRADWPPRAKIRGVPPIGVGTGWVEAASGILVRTAAENRVSVRRLLERVLAEAVGDPNRLGESAEDIAALGRDLSRRPAASVNGGWGTARSLVRILGAATLQADLEQTTTIPWSERLQRRGLLHEYRAFCPACLHDWMVSGQEPCEPLRWQYQALETHLLVGTGAQPDFLSLLSAASQGVKTDRQQAGRLTVRDLLKTLRL